MFAMDGACTSRRREAFRRLAPGGHAAAMRAGLVLCALLGPASPAPAEDVSGHRQAALELYLELRLDDSRAVAETVTGLLLQFAPSFAPHRDVIEEFAAEVVSSEAYVNAQVDAYVDLFEEEELRTLTWLFRHETMRSYRQKRIELIRRNTQSTVDLFRAMLPRLHERIRERDQEGARK